MFARININRFIPIIGTFTSIGFLSNYTKAEGQLKISSSSNTQVTADDFFKSPPVKPAVTVPQAQPAKKTFAKKFPKGNYQFLVFGETGSGKSTFINVMTNYFKNGSLTKPFINIPNAFYKSTERGSRHTERNIGDRTKAQTDKATEYKFSVNGANFGIIDTPGLNDTEGIEQDDANIEIIMNAAIDANNLTAIVLILNGTNARATANITSMITRFKGFLPDSIMDNIIIVFTNCHQETCNFTDLSILGFEPKQVFFMNNSAFSQNPKNWTDTTILDLEWDKSMQTCDDISTFVTKMSKVSTNDFKSIKAIRNKVKSLLHDAKLKIQNLQKVQEEYELAMAAMQKYSASAEQFKDYTVKKTVQKFELVDAPYHSTICSECSKVCHDHCGLNEISDRGSNQFVSCSCMGNGDGNKDICNKCGCSYKTHYHDHKTMQQTTVTLDEELQDIKAKYLAAVSDADTNKTKMTDNELIKKGLEDAIDKLKADIVNESINLKKICKGYNLVDELTGLIYQLEQGAKLLTSVEARKTADNFIKCIKDLCDSFATMDTSKIRTTPTKSEFNDTNSESEQESNVDNESDNEPKKKRFFGLF